MALRDAGAEVIYLGLRQTPAQIVAAAQAEDADVIGISVLSGVHLPLARQIREAQQAAGVDDIPLVVGGTIPAQDIPALTGLGVRAVYGVGTPIDDVVAGVHGPGPRDPGRRTLDTGPWTAARSDHHRLRHPGRPLVRAAGGTRPPAGRARRAPVHPRPVRVHVPGAAVDHAPVRGVRLRRGHQRPLPVPAQPGPDRAVGRVRPADPARLRLLARAGQQRGRPGGRGHRHRGRHGRRVRRPAAGGPVGQLHHQRDRPDHPGLLHRGRGAARGGPGPAGRHAAERHPQGIPGPQALRVPAAALAPAHRGRGRVLRPGTAALQPDLHHRLPRPRGRLRRHPGDRAHHGLGHRLRGAFHRPRPGRSTRSRRGCPSTSPASWTCSRRRPRSARPAASGTRSPPSGSARPTRTRAGCVSSPAARAPR